MIEWLLIVLFVGDGSSHVVPGFSDKSQCETAIAAMKASNRYAVSLSACVLRTGAKPLPTNVEHR